MARQTKITSNLTGLGKLTDDLRGMRARVGVLGDSGKNTRSDDEGMSPITNAELGVIHEFGSESRNIPPRSFLRMPIEEKKDSLVRGIRKSTVFRGHVESGNIEKAMETVGVLAEAIVQEAFETKGFGQWPAKAPATQAQSQNPDQPLIESGQLRKAITSDAVKEGF